jgi:hypothetical protein
MDKSQQQMAGNLKPRDTYKLNTELLRLVIMTTRQIIPFNIMLVADTDWRKWHPSLLDELSFVIQSIIF